MRAARTHNPPAFLLCPTLAAAATFPSFVLPGVVALTLPRFYKRHREAVVVVGKLLNVASWPVFRFSWQAPGAPLDVRVEFGSVWARLPVHPLAAVQCGAVSMMSLSIRHSLRFKTQLLCQLAMLVVVMQTEAVGGSERGEEPRGGCGCMGRAACRLLACLVLAHRRHACAAWCCRPVQGPAPSSSNHLLPARRPRTGQPLARSSTFCRCATPRCCSWCVARCGRWCSTTSTTPGGASCSSRCSGGGSSSSSKRSSQRGSSRLRRGRPQGRHGNGDRTTRAATAPTN